MTRQELRDAYLGLNNNRPLPFRIVAAVVDQLKSFLLGDGNRRIAIVAEEPADQPAIKGVLQQSRLLDVLQSSYDDVLVYGEAFIDYSQPELRHIPIEQIDEVIIDPADPFRVVLLREQRPRYNPLMSANDTIQIEHSLELPENSLDKELDPLAAPDYEYRLRINGIDQEASGNSIPILRVMNSLRNGVQSESPIEGIIHAQLEYCEVRNRINLLGKHTRPQMYTIGTSAPKVIGRSNKPLDIDTQDGSYAFQTAWRDESPSILHFPTSQDAVEAGILPKIGYLQALDSTTLDRQLAMVIQDIYLATGAMVLDLANARSASSASSLSILYEPLTRFTAERARYLQQAIRIILAAYGIQVNYRIDLPDMRPTDADERRAKADLVSRRILSRKRFLMEVYGLSEQEADLEIAQLNAESSLNIQYSSSASTSESSSISDSLDVPNETHAQTQNGNQA